MERGKEGLKNCLEFTAEEVPGWGNRAGVRYLAQSTLSITQQMFKAAVLLPTQSPREAAVASARCHILSLGFSWPQERRRILTLQGNESWVAVVTAYQLSLDSRWLAQSPGLLSLWNQVSFLPLMVTEYVC